MPPRLGKFVVNVFLILYLTLVGIHALPHECRGLKNATRSFYNTLGVWQSGWALFSPEPDSINTSVYGVIYLDDGEAVMWNTPDWMLFGPWKKMRLFRHMEFYDNIRSDSRKDAWPVFADFVARSVPLAEGVSVESVELVRKWKIIEPPEENFIPYGSPPRPEEEYSFYLHDPLLPNEEEWEEDDDSDGVEEEPSSEAELADDAPVEVPDSENGGISE